MRHRTGFDIAGWFYVLLLPVSFLIFIIWLIPCSYREAVEESDSNNNIQLKCEKENMPDYAQVRECYNYWWGKAHPGFNEPIKPHRIK